MTTFTGLKSGIRDWSSNEFTMVINDHVCQVVRTSCWQCVCIDEGPITSNYNLANRTTNTVNCSDN